jgi:hypothetical protein
VILLAIAFYKDVVSWLQLINVAEESIAVSGQHRVPRVARQSRVSQVSRAEGEWFVTRAFQDHSIKIYLRNGNPSQASDARSGRIGEGILSLKFLHQLALLLIHPEIISSDVKRQQGAQADEKNGEVLPDATMRWLAQLNETAPSLHKLVTQFPPAKGGVSWSHTWSPGTHPHNYEATKWRAKQKDEEVALPRCCSYRRTMKPATSEPSPSSPNKGRNVAVAGRFCPLFLLADVWSAVLAWSLLVAAWVPLGEVLVAAFGSAVWFALLLAAVWSLDGWAYAGAVAAAVVLVELLAAVWSLVGEDEGWALAADALWSAGAVVVVVCVLAADALWSAGAVVVVVVVVVEGLAAISLLGLAGAAAALVLADASGVVEAAAPDGAAPAALLQWSAIILTSLTCRVLLLALLLAEVPALLSGVVLEAALPEACCPVIATSCPTCAFNWSALPVRVNTIPVWSWVKVKLVSEVLLRQPWTVEFCPVAGLLLWVLGVLLWLLAVPLVDVSCATPSVAASSAAERNATAFVMQASIGVYSPEIYTPGLDIAIRYTP